MVLRPYVSPQTSSKSSKLIALTALVIAFLLPWFLVKTFRGQQHFSANHTPHILSEARKKTWEIQSVEELNHKAALLAGETFYTAALASLKEKITVIELTQPNQPTPKSATQETWAVVTTRGGDSLASIFKRLKLSSQTLHAILKDNPHAKTLAKIKPGLAIQVLARNSVLEKLIIPISTTQFITISRNGNYFQTEIHDKKTTSNALYLTATVSGSLYATAKRMNIPYKLVDQMTEIFKWDIDFAREVKAGDQFTIIYNGLFIDNKRVGTGEITAVTYNNHGKVHQAIRHTSPSGDFDYYTPEGRSLRKAFTRYPIKFSHISSTFSLSRQHPVLHYKRPHKGVDLAASIGTPVFATGDGRIEIIGSQSGYGNMIKISHNLNYTSVYAHMLKFQKGLTKGAYVRRGQVIGYVGQTGLATGPHCHYEFHVNHQPKNPTTVDLPRALPVPIREMIAFKTKAGTLLAQMKLFQESKLASSGKKSAITG